MQLSQIENLLCREGRECFAGLGLISTTELPAFVLVFPDDRQRHVLPSQLLEARRP